MKKIVLAAIASVAFAGVASAQETTNALAPTKAGDNWSITLKGGIANPVHPFHGTFGDNVRGAAGLEVRKQISPTIGLGVEGTTGFNTSTWNYQPSMHNVVDGMYVGVFGAVNLNNLFAGYAGQPRVFEVELVGGTGWIHTFVPKSQGHDTNDMGVRSGVNFNFNLGESKAWTIGIKPSILWNVTNKEYTVFSARAASLELMAGVTYHFGNSNGTHSFAYAAPCDYQPYNDQINALRAMVVAQEAGIAELSATNADLTAANATLASALQQCQSRPATVVTQTDTTNTLQSVRYVFYRIGSSKITADQQPNVEMIAQYMKNNPEATVEINGYASKDGNLEFNERLAKNRAESVKTMLVNKYGIKADRIKAQGKGIGEMFKEESWNRVAICVLNDK
ncbi:MAG: OmpA family protein [Muribaculaceae bacterium]|nr:OmpA family protein [Bacteroides sp.]MBD5415190.1 OmpA family protein [Bacteroides sp.]MDE6223710.1 OmpA family protein [Muribaculaceae bacterium]MDE6228366.1 OmpA family protein [Muribaculaceae bacterium]